MKKLQFALLAGLGLFSITACDSTYLNSKQENTEVLTFDHLYDYSAISGINLLSTSATPGRMARRMQQNVTAEQKDELIQKLQIVEEMLTDSIFRSELAESDREEFETMYTLTTRSFNDEDQVYIFYYNEIFKLDKNGEKKNEQKSRLEGIVIYNDVEYQMIGEREVEHDEIEMEFKVTLDEENYVIMKQESESDEQEFEYVQYRNGEKVLQTEIEFETNHEKNKMEIKFKEKSEEGTKEYKYEFKTIEDRKFVEIKIAENQEEIKVKIEIIVDEFNQVQYVFQE